MRWEDRVSVVVQRCVLRFDETKIGHSVPFGKAATDHENGDQCDVDWFLTRDFQPQDETFVHLRTETN